MTAASGADREEVRADFWQDYADGHPDAVAYVAASGADQPALRDQLRDEIAGHPIGSGYYSTSVGVTEAGEIADALLPLIEADRERAKAEAVQPVLDLADEWEAGMRAMGYRDGHHDGARAIRAALRGSP